MKNYKRPLFLYGGFKVTDRERDVWRGLANSKTMKQLADMLKISIKTVEHHRRRLTLKLGITDIAGLTRLAIKCKLIQL